MNSATVSFQRVVNNSLGEWVYIPYFTALAAVTRIMKKIDLIIQITSSCFVRSDDMINRFIMTDDGNKYI